MKCSYLLVFFLIIFGICAGCSQSSSAPATTPVTLSTLPPTFTKTTVPTTAPVTAAITTPTSVSTDTITILSTAYDPDSVTVPAGTIVRWVNADGKVHSVVFVQYSKYQTKINPSGALASGQSFSVRFTDKGTYTYYDGMHPTLKGTVIVE